MKPFPGVGEGVVAAMEYPQGLTTAERLTLLFHGHIMHVDRQHLDSKARQTHSVLSIRRLIKRNSSNVGKNIKRWINQ
ncbi:MAG: hypothetical protein PHV34_21155 [Verrucomicrobiae bacterium]|nr:hypothetical protein [Verrucomicrobiae bacterium]